MSNPLYAWVMNTTKHSVHLEDGMGDSISVMPSLDHKKVKIDNRFLTWAPVPKGIKIFEYETHLGNKVDASLTGGKVQLFNKTTTSTSLNEAASVDSSAE